MGEEGQRQQPVTALRSCAYSVRKQGPGSPEDIWKSQIAASRTNCSGACAGSAVSLEFH